MEKHQLKDLLDKFLEGRASEAEKLEVENWYSSFESTPGITEFLNEQEIKKVESKLFNSINSRLDEQLSSSIDDSAQPIRKLKKSWMIAASVIILLGVFLTKLVLQSENYSTEWTEVKAGKYEIKEVDLPDGSQVWLNANSSIRFKTTFTGAKREVWMQGEAYFDVMHDKLKAFEVHTGKVTTHVLGTAFNIKADNRDEVVSVSVTRGKVAVDNSAGKRTMVNPDEQATYLEKTEKFAVRKVKSKALVSWITGDLVFKNESFSQIAAKLERHFNIKIIFSHENIKNLKLSASFDTDISVGNVLRMLGKVSKTEIHRLKDTNTYTIKNRSKR